MLALAWLASYAFWCLMVPPLGPIDASESAAYLVEVALGRYSSGPIGDWVLSDDFDHDMAVSSLPDHLDVWSEGSLVLDRLTGVSSPGSGFFTHQAEHFWRSRRWGHVDGVRIDPNIASCRGFCPVPGSFQSVQRAEMWGVILALQSSGAVHLGVDNLGVVRHVGRLLDGCRGTVPFVLVKDGDLLLLIERMLHLEVSTRFGFLRLKVMLMRVWFLMVGFERLTGWVMTLLMRLLIWGVEGSVLLSLTLVVTCLGSVVAGTLLSLTFIVFSLLFLVLWSIMMVGMVLLLILLSGLLVLSPRGVGWFMRFGDRAFLPGPPGIWDSEWFTVPATAICAEDIALWPYTPGLLKKWVSSLSSFHWPVGDLDLGVGGVSFVELLILYELWAGERLFLEKAHPRYLRPGRPISVSACSFSSRH